MGEAGGDVVAFEALEAVVEAECEGKSAELPVGAQTALDVRTIAPPSEVCQSVMVTEVDFIVCFSICGTEEYSERRDLNAFADAEWFAAKFQTAIFSTGSQCGSGPHQGLCGIIAVAGKVDHASICSYGRADSPVETGRGMPQTFNAPVETEREIVHP